MGTFAETAIVDYRLSFADRGKHLIFRFCLQLTNWKFAVSVFCLKKTNGSCCFPLIVEVDFWNSVEVIIFLELL
jgi:hypothetical protein